MLPSRKKKFQSHAGSIEAGSSAGTFNAFPMFQSHAGSIEAFRGHWRRLRSRLCFNPTLVRLRPTCVGGPSSLCSRFNPTLVRLRPTTPKLKWGSHVTFQSHAGSIEAERTYVKGFCLKLFQSHAGSIEAEELSKPEGKNRRFNPTLVRLRLDIWAQIGVINIMFQSHAGSIEAGIVRWRDRLADIGFNPTLVRLRPGSPSILRSGIRQFQSHAGSIEAYFQASTAPRSHSVSIPRWFD